MSPYSNLKSENGRSTNSIQTPYFDNSTLQNEWYQAEPLQNQHRISLTALQCPHYPDSMPSGLSKSLILVPDEPNSAHNRT